MSAIEAVVRTAEDAGQTIVVGRVADRLVGDFPYLKLDRDVVYLLVATECARRRRVPYLLEDFSS